MRRYMQHNPNQQDNIVEELKAALQRSQEEKNQLKTENDRTKAALKKSQEEKDNLQSLYARKIIEYDALAGGYSELENRLKRSDKIGQRQEIEIFHQRLNQSAR